MTTCEGACCLASAAHGRRRNRNDDTDAFTPGAFRFTNGGAPIEDNTPFTVGDETYVQYNAGTGNDFFLTTGVPEPGTTALLLAGLPLLALRRRRRAWRKSD